MWNYLVNKALQVKRNLSSMGAEQSGSGAQLKSQRDDDIPYTSFSISKPIDGVKDDADSSPDSPKASPRLVSKSKSHAHKDKDSSLGSQTHDIVVVAEGAQEESPVDVELQRLESIPVFLPLMRGSLNLPSLRDHDALDKLDARQVLQLCVRYQEHLKQSAEAVAFDQNALCIRIKEIDFAIHTLYNLLTERQKKFAKCAEQIQKIHEMTSVLNRVKMNVEQTIPLMERLNSVLPPDDQLEPFSMRPSNVIN